NVSSTEANMSTTRNGTSYRNPHQAQMAKNHNGRFSTATLATAATKPACPCRLTGLDAEPTSDGNVRVPQGSPVATKLL
ncbi:MAG: hypothetical protein QOD97_3994, partial [Mycobacterium sp.]|nr:hypothetical protein [Mycobacterium sp.]